MKVLVVGLGSMGKRRIRLMRQAFPDICICGVDLNKDRMAEVSSLGVEKVYTTISEAVEDYRPEISFVCTAPLSHYKIIRELLLNNLHVFTELNLVSDGYQELIDLAKEKGLVLFLSSTLLYRKDLQYIINSVKDKKVNYIYHCGQYLPDWHPWENYKNFFVNETRTNGCREILAIDLPWLLAAMGEVNKISVVSDKISNLEINYNDNYFITLQHENGSKGTIIVDIVSRKARRSLEIFSENVHILWDGTPKSLLSFNDDTKEMDQVETYKEIDKNKNYSDNIIENAYTDEIFTFISCIQKKSKPLYNFENDIVTLDLIDKIEGKA